MMDMQALLFLVLSAAVAAGIWRLSKEGRAGAGDAARVHPKKQKAEIAAQDMVQCATCGAFVVRDAHQCERAGCPYPPPKDVS